MRTTITLDDDLLEKAMRLTGIKDRTPLIRESLKAIIARESARRLALLGGSMPDFEVPPRRRPEIEPGADSAAGPGTERKQAVHMPEIIQNDRARQGAVLVDTSVWVEFIRFGSPQLSHLLVQGRVLMHDMVMGEIACGSVLGRGERLAVMGELFKIDAAEHSEVLKFIEKHQLSGCGIGYVDSHLLASVALTPGCGLWSRDKNLHAVVQRMGCSFRELAH